MENSTALSLRDFWDRLNGHDWLYRYAEGRDYYWGRDSEDRLRALAQENGPAYTTLFNAFAAHHNVDNPARPPKPERPDPPLPLFD